KPFVTLTYAQSIDSKIAAHPGARTVLSGPESKAMTHYLRSQHDAILIGVGTAIADNPSLSCRIKGRQNFSPRPIILDPTLRWNPDSTSKLVENIKSQKGKAPYIIACSHAIGKNQQNRGFWEKIGAEVIYLPSSETKDGHILAWDDVLRTLGDLGVSSVMVEGGATVIRQLLAYDNLVDSFIITIAPKFLGTEGPSAGPVTELCLRDTKWLSVGEDTVLLGR
ncbi:hypothetical protein CANCADRAFT_18801, partial [Tortispora caseinolytica NRRL Y-17796]